MKTLKVITVDDEAPALRRLNKMVQNHEQLSLLASARNSVEAVSKIKKHQANILLLDIELKDATAFEVLDKIKNYYKGHVIFITAFDEYAIKAFEFGAVDYLLKPFSEKRFCQSIDRLLNDNKSTDIESILTLLKKHNDNKIRVSEGNKIHFFNEDKINFIKAEGYYSEFYLDEEKKLLRQSLKELEKILPNNFIRIHKSFIVNSKKIDSLNQNKATLKINLKDGTEFQVSKSFLDSAKKQLGL